MQIPHIDDPERLPEQSIPFVEEVESKIKGSSKPIRIGLETAITYPINLFSEHIGSTLSQILSLPNKNEQLEGTLQVSQLQDMYNMLLRSIDHDTTTKSLPSQMTSMTYYLYEVGNDNAATVSESDTGTVFDNAGVVEIFARAALEYIEDGDFDKALSSIIDLDLTHITNSTSSVISNFARMVKNEYNQIPGSDVIDEFIDDPNKALLRLNMVAFSIAHAEVVRVRDSNKDDEAIQWLAGITIQGEVLRYLSGIALNGQIHMGVKDAMILGGNTILMKYAMPAFMLFLADSNSKYSDLVNNHQETFKSIFENMSTVTRLINDGAGVFGNYKQSTNMLRELAEETSGTGISARRFLQNLQKIDLDRFNAVKLLMPKLVKDLAEEGEYNILGNATSISGKHSTFEAILENAETLYPIFQKSRAELRNCFDKIDKAGSREITDSFLGFLYFMFIMYKEGYDFDSPDYHEMRANFDTVFSVDECRKFVEYDLDEL